MTLLTEATLLLERNSGWALRCLRGIVPLCLALSISAAAVVGCEKAPPTVTDLSKAPWLDPKVQAEGLKNGDMRIRGLSAFHLGNIGERAADAIPALEKLAQTDPEPKVRELSKQAVDKIRAALATGDSGD